VWFEGGMVELGCIVNIDLFDGEGGVGWGVEEAVQTPAHVLLSQA